MFTCVLVTSLTVGAPALKDERREAKAPIGLWKVEGMRYDGVTVETRNSRVQIGQRSFTYMMPFECQGQAYWFAINRTQQVDIMLPGSVGTAKGIWRVVGDELTICTGREGGDRPDEFDAPRGSGRTLWKLSRIGD
jgi:hypothetical protein